MKNARQENRENYLVFVPVSYTHLDVYKRQAYNRQMAGYTAFSEKSG